MATDGRLEAETQFRKLEEELRLEKDMWLSTILLSLNLSDNVGKQDGKLDTLLCSFAKLGGHKLPQIKVQVFETKPEGDAKRWSPLESEESEEEDVVIEKMKQTKHPMLSKP